MKTVSKKTTPKHPNCKPVATPVQIIHICPVCTFELSNDDYDADLCPSCGANFLDLPF